MKFMARSFRRAGEPAAASSARENTKATSGIPSPWRFQASNTGRRSVGGDVDVHIVGPRDTVASIAKQHGVSVGNVVRWNNLESGDSIRPGDRLRVTAQSPSAEPSQGGFR